MDGKAKIQTLTNAWYGYTAFSALVSIGSALLLSGRGGSLAIPLVLVVSLFSFFVSWAIGKLLLQRSSLTRAVVLVFSFLGLFVGAANVWHFVVGPWTASASVNAFLVCCGAWMQLRTIGTLLDRSVKSYFA